MIWYALCVALAHHTRAGKTDERALDTKNATKTIAAIDVMNKAAANEVQFIEE